MGENLRMQLIIHTVCETWMNERLCVQKVAKHLLERKIVIWHLRHSHKLKFSMKSLAFLCLICAPNLYFAQKLLRGTKNCWVTRTAKKLLQEPKVAQKLPSTIGTGLLVVVLPSVTDVFTPVILNWIGLQTILIATVSVKMVGTAGLWGLLVHSMLVYKIWWSNRDKQLWEGRGEHEKGKNSVWLKCPNYFCLRLWLASNLSI